MILFFIFVGALAKQEDLWAAVKMDDKAKILAALENGADINANDRPNGQSALMQAVLEGKETAVETLLAMGADTTIGEKNGYTPMHGAGYQGRGPIARILAAHGVPIDDKHEDGFTPVERACWGNEKRHAKTVGILLQLGAVLDDPARCNTKNDFTKKVVKAHIKSLAPDL